MNKIDMITEVRGFNRFYTNILGLLDRHILHSGYSLTEGRVLFEISKTEHCTANQLCSALDIDRGYMSRIISKFEKNGLLTRHTSSMDNRFIEIHLTKKGFDVFHKLNNRSNQQIDDLISKLESHESENLISAMRTVKKYFSIATKDIKIRPYKKDDIFYIIDRQLSLYELERQFTSDTWKNYLIKGVNNLVENFNAEKDCIFILECDGNPAGCIAITHVEEEVAQLRYFFLEPELRGLGAGTSLIDMAINFCREKKYKHVFLWTVSAQESARILYKKAGFNITETSENSDWGVPVVEERWDLDL